MILGPLLPDVDIEVEIRDPADAPVVAAAVAGRAEAIVTATAICSTTPSCDVGYRRGGSRFFVPLRHWKRRAEPKLEPMPGPITVAYYYRVRWGALDEFIELFERNHWPILREQLAAGRFLDVRAATPRFHGDGRADWNFLVTIVYRDWAAIEDHSEAEIAARRFPDQERFAAEERRRFELLEAHWDVPLEDRPLPKE